MTTRRPGGNGGSGGGPPEGGGPGDDDGGDPSWASARSEPTGSPSDVGAVLRRGVKSALTRWVLAKRRASHGSAHPHAPSPHDEATHAWDGRRRFAEDYTFVGVQAGLGVVLRLEQLPGRDSQRVWVVILRPDGAWALPGGQQVLRVAGDDRWRAGGLALDCETPLRRWGLRFAGALERVGPGHGTPLRVVGHAAPGVRTSIDLTFVATAPAFVPGTDDDPELLARCLGHASWDARLLRAVRRDRPRGYVQLGELHGTLALGEVLVPVRAASLRQHHWGVRDWGACDDAFQCFWATDERGRQGRGWVQHARFPFVTVEGGFTTWGPRPDDRAPVVRPSALDPVRRLAVTHEARPRRAPARVSLSVGEPSGMRSVPLELTSDLSFVVDGRGRVDLALARVTGPTPGWGLWAGLTRTLPRP